MTVKYIDGIEYIFENDAWHIAKEAASVAVKYMDGIEYIFENDAWHIAKEIASVTLTATHTDVIMRLGKAYGMIEGATFKMPPSTGGEVMEDGEVIADVTGDCESGFTVTGRSA